MACYTVVEVNLDDNTINRLARKHLKLSETGSLTQEQATRVRHEAGLIKATKSIQKLDPRAVIKRVTGKNGKEELRVTVIR